MKNTYVQLPVRRPRFDARQADAVPMEQLQHAIQRTRLRVDTRIDDLSRPLGPTCWRPAKRVLL
jgi:hypothetical protein